LRDDGFLKKPKQITVITYIKLIINKNKSVLQSSSQPERESCFGFRNKYVDGLKLNGKHQLLTYADYVNILGGSVHSLKDNAETLVVATKIGLEVSADKTKYKVMSKDRLQGGVTV
jgi:hypothetical protein